jgi:hypothetical protein
MGTNATMMAVHIQKLGCLVIELFREEYITVFCRVRCSAAVVAQVRRRLYGTNVAIIRDTLRVGAFFLLCVPENKKGTGMPAPGDTG